MPLVPIVRRGQPGAVIPYLGPLALAGNVVSRLESVKEKIGELFDGVGKEQSEHSSRNSLVALEAGVVERHRFPPEFA